MGVSVFDLSSKEETMSEQENLMDVDNQSKESEIRKQIESILSKSIQKKSGQKPCSTDVHPLLTLSRN